MDPRKPVPARELAAQVFLGERPIDVELQRAAHTFYVDLRDWLTYLVNDATPKEVEDYTRVSNSNGGLILYPSQFAPWSGLELVVFKSPENMINPALSAQGGQRIAAGGTYDPQSDVLTVGINGLNVEDHVKKILKMVLTRLSTAERTITHEFVHHFDNQRSGGKAFIHGSKGSQPGWRGRKQSKEPFLSPEWSRRFSFDNPAEMNAYVSHSVQPMFDWLRLARERIRDGSALDDSGFALMLSSYGRFEDFFNWAMIGYATDWQNKLSPETQKRLRSRMYSVWSTWKGRLEQIRAENWRNSAARQFASRNPQVGS